MRIVRIVNTLGLLVSLALFAGCSGDDQQAEEAVAAAAKEKAAAEEKAAADAKAAEEKKAAEEAAAAAEALAAVPPAPPPPAPAPPPAPPVQQAPTFPAPPLPNGPQIGYNVGNYLLVKVDHAQVRQGPGAMHPVVSKLQAGEKVTIAERRDGWIRVGQGQWLSESVVTAFLRKYTVKAKAAEVRSGPNPRSRLVQTLTEGSQVDVQAMDGKWAKIGPQRYVLRAQLNLSK